MFFAAFFLQGFCFALEKRGQHFSLMKLAERNAMKTPTSSDILAARLGYAIHETKDLFTEEQLADLAKAAARIAPPDSFVSSPKSQMSGLEANLKKFIQAGEGYEPDSMTEADSD